MAVASVGVPSSDNSGSATATSFQTTWPTVGGTEITPTAGQWAVLFGHVSATNLTMSVPAGWNAISGMANPFNEGTASRLYAWAKELTASEAAPLITNSGSVTGGWEMHVFDGASGVRGLRQGTSGTSVALPTLTGCVAGSMLLASVGARVASGTIPSGIDPDAAYTETIDHATNRSTGSANFRMETATRALAAAGDFGGETFSVANSVTSSMIAALVEVQPDVTASEVTLTPATGAFTAVATSPVPGPVTVDLAPAGGSFGAVAVAATPGAVSVSLTPATGSWVGVGTDPVPGAVTVALSPAGGAFGAVAVAPGAGPGEVALTPAVAAFSVIPVGVVPGAVTVDLTPAALAAVAVALGVPITDKPIPSMISVDRPAAVVAAGGDAPAWVTSTGDRPATEVQA